MLSVTVPNGDDSSRASHQEMNVSVSTVLQHTSVSRLRHWMSGFKNRKIPLESGTDVWRTLCQVRYKTYLPSRKQVLTDRTVTLTCECPAVSETHCYVNNNVPPHLEDSSPLVTGLKQYNKWGCVGQDVYFCCMCNPNQCRFVTLITRVRWEEKHTARVRKYSQVIL